MAHDDADTPLGFLFGISFILENRLKAIGIRTLGDLQRVGACTAYHRLLDHGETSPRLSLLYALDGAARWKHWWDFSPEEKATIRERWERTAKGGEESAE